MKKRILLITALVLANIVVVGCIPRPKEASPTAQQAAQAAAYLDVVRADFVKAGNYRNDAQLLQWAFDSCMEMDDGKTFNDVLDALNHKRRPVRLAYAGALGAAMSAFCPQHLHYLELR